jgi:hypothetical protein
MSPRLFGSHFARRSFWQMDIAFDMLDALSQRSN